MKQFFKIGIHTPHRSTNWLRGPEHGYFFFLRKFLRRQVGVSNGNLKAERVVAIIMALIGSLVILFSLFAYFSDDNVVCVNFQGTCLISSWDAEATPWQYAA